MDAARKHFKRWSTFVHAAYVGDYRVVKEMVDEGYINKCCEVNGIITTALGAACHTGQVNILLLLIQCGADVNAKCDESTPLHIACDEGNLRMAKILLSHGACIEDTDWYGRTALHRASDSDHNDVVRMLLAHGAVVDAKDDDGWTPLHIARSGPVTQTLLEYGADVNARDSQGYTSLVRMSVCDQVDRVSALLDYGSGSGVPCKLEQSRSKPCNKTELMCYLFCSNKILREWFPCFEKHFIKTRCAGIKHCDSEIPDNQQLQAIDWTSAQRNSFRKECEEELVRLRAETINNTSATYFDVLKRTLPNLRGQRILGSLTGDLCCHKYPIYGRMIFSSYLKLRNFLLRDLVADFFSLTAHWLPVECAQLILNYLSNEDLTTLVNVCDTVKRCDVN